MVRSIDSERGLVAQRQTYAKLSIFWIALWLQAWRQWFATSLLSVGLWCDDKRTPSYLFFGVALWLQAWRRRFVVNPMNAGLSCRNKLTPNYPSLGLCYGYKLGD